MALIPAPLGKLVTMATRLPSIFGLLKRMVQTKGGRLGIVMILGAIAASKAIEKIQETKKAAVLAAKEEAEAQRGNLTGLTGEQLDDAEAAIDEIANAVEDVPLSAEEVEAVVEEKIEEIEPKIASALAPFTALIGIPIFLITLMDYLSTPIGTEVMAYLDQAYPAESGEEPLTSEQDTEAFGGDVDMEEDDSSLSAPLTDPPDPDPNKTSTTTTTTTTTSSGGGGGGGGGGDGGDGGGQTPKENGMDELE